MIHIEEPAIQIEDYEYSEALEPDANSLSHFCQFVDYYTRHSTDPLYTAAVCEKQAKEVRITQQDVSQESLFMLIETVVMVINHLEKKWLDEQMQREDLEQRRCKDLGREKRQNWLKHLSRTWTRRIWNRFVQSRHVNATM